MRMYLILKRKNIDNSKKKKVIDEDEIMLGGEIGDKDKSEQQKDKVRVSSKTQKITSFFYT